MAVATPTFTDNVSVIAPTSVAAGGLTSGSIDLRTKKGAWLFIAVGRQGATVPAAAMQIKVRRVLNNGTAPSLKNIYVAFASTITANNATTVNVDSASGQLTLGVASATGVVAGDDWCIYDTALTRLEFATVSKVSGTTITFDDNLQYTHTSAQADNVARYADRFTPIWLEGGSLYTVTADYGAAATGSNIVVRAFAQTYDSDLIV